MVNQYTKEIEIKGTKYLFHKTVKTEELTDFKQRFERGNLLNLFNQSYGRIIDNKEKQFRKLLTAVIRAKNNPINKDKTDIIVKLSDRNIKLTPLLYKG